MTIPTPGAPARHGRRQRGVAAIELVLILGFILTLLSCTMLFGSMFWSYNTQQKTLHNMARFLSSVSPAEISNLGAALTATNTGREIGREAALQARLAGERLDAKLECQPNPEDACGYALSATSPRQTPAWVRVSQRVELTGFRWYVDIADFFEGADFWSLRISITVPYVP